jgi:signal recognition particle subunit SEC65
MEVQSIEISKLVPYAKNPNRMTPEKYRGLVAAIDQAGFLQPILVAEFANGSYGIVDGHHRVKAAEELGMTAVPAVVVPEEKLPEDWQRATRIGMNRNRGDADLGLIAEEIADLTKLGWSPDDLAVTGFSAGEIGVLLDSLGAEDAANTLAGGAVDPAALANPEPPQEAGEGTVVLEIQGFGKKEITKVKRALRQAGGGDLRTGLLAVLFGGDGPRKDGA